LDGTSGEEDLLPLEVLALPGLGMDDTCLMVGFVWPNRDLQLSVAWEREEEYRRKKRIWKKMKRKVTRTTTPAQVLGMYLCYIVYMFD
jgi:hypothetical protein